MRDAHAQAFRCEDFEGDRENFSRVFTVADRCANSVDVNVPKVNGAHLIRFFGEPVLLTNDVTFRKQNCELNK